MDTVEDTIVVVLMGIMAALQSVFLVIDLWRNPWACSSNPFPISGCCSQGAKRLKDGQQSRLEVRLAEIRVESYLMFANILMYCCGATGVGLLCRIVVQEKLISDAASRIMTILIYVPGLLLRFFPGLLNTHTVCIVHFYYMGVLYSFGTHFALQNASYFMHYYPALLIIRVALGFIYPVAWFNTLWNISWGVVAAIGNYKAACISTDVPLNNIILTETLVVVFLSGVFWQYERVHISQVRSDIEASGYLRSKRTMERLLADMCDAVVELDPTLRVRKACPRLAGLLLRQTGITALQGEHFPNMVFTEPDRERFAEFVAQRAVPLENEQDLDGDRQASSMYLSLRDATNSPVTVQLFHSCHYDAPDEVCHIVGVHEVERDFRAGARDTVGEVAQPVNGAGGAGGEVGQRATPGDDAESVASMPSIATGSDSDAPIVLMPLIPEEKSAVPLSVYFNPIAEEIIACTIGFQSLTGPLLSKARLRDVIANYGDFCVWLHAEVDRFFRHVQPEKFQLKLASSKARKKMNFGFRVDTHILDVLQNVWISELGLQQPETADEERFDAICVMVLGEPEPRWPRKTNRIPRLMREREPVTGPRTTAASL